MSQNMKNTLLLFTTLTLVLSATGYPLFPFVVFHMCMMNNFASDVLSLRCYHDNGDWITIPAHGSYNWSFHQQQYFGKKKTYFCDAQWGVKGGRGGFRSFEAFADEPLFVDLDCGGRHCIWGYNESALFMFNLKSQAYVSMYSWGPIP